MVALQETSFAALPGAVTETVAVREPASLYEVGYDALFPGTSAAPVFFQTKALPDGAEALQTMVSPVNAEDLSALQEREGGFTPTVTVSVTVAASAPEELTAPETVLHEMA
jgi:hypothetical protein